jgi:hypothetical protein
MEKQQCIFFVIQAVWYFAVLNDNGNFNYGIYKNFLSQKVNFYKIC